MKIAPKQDGIPVVTSTAMRDTLYPSPATNQRVHNLETGAIELYNGTAWVVILGYPILSGETGVTGTLYPYGHLFRYGATGNGVADDSTAIQNAYNSLIALGGGTMTVPHGSFNFVASGLVDLVSVDTSRNIKILALDARAEFVTTSAIDLISLKCTNAAGNLRRITIDGLGLRVNNAAARGLVLDGAAYNQFSNLDISGAGAALVCGDGAQVNNTLSNQFQNVRITQPLTGVRINGLYNQFSNLTIAEGITGAYALSISGTGNHIVNLFARGAGGAGGTATVIVNGDAVECVIVGGVVTDSYAIGMSVGAGRHNKILGVTIINSQTHGLQLSGALQGRFDVTCQNNGLAAADTYNHINGINGPTDNIVTAQFVGSQCLYDYAENSTAARNTLICGTRPNGISLGASTTTRQPLNWIIGKGTTANRPTLGASDIGTGYLDTTLAANGKHIVWNGTLWVDSTGASV